MSVAIPQALLLQYLGTNYSTNVFSTCSRSVYDFLTPDHSHVRLLWP